MMNKLRKKPSSNRSLDKASKEDAPATPPPNRQPLDYHLPDSNFRSSLILPDLGRRFSLLARANQPELVKAKLAELRATGGVLSKEEEDLVLEELNQLGQASTSTTDEVVHSPSHRSLFGASNRDVENMRKASSRGLTPSPSGEIGGKSRRRLVNGGGKERTSTLAELVSSKEEDPSASSLQPSATSPIESTLLPSPPFVSTIDESTLEQPPPPPSSSTSIHDDDDTVLPSASSRRKSLLDSLSPEQMKRVSSTLAQLEQSFFNSPLSINGTVINGLPSQEELSTASSRLPTTEDEERGGGAGSIKMTPGKPRSSSNASSMASVVTNGGGKGGHRAARSGSISASEGRLTGYIPGMPRPITPQSRAGSSTSSTPRFSAPSQIATSTISPLSPTSPSEHLRSPSLTPSRRFDPSASSSSTQNRFESYASSSLSSRRLSDDSDLLPHELDQASSPVVLPSSFESSRTLMSAMDAQASSGSVSDGQVASDSLSLLSRTRRSLAPSPEPPTSSSSSPVLAANGPHRSPLSSIHPESLREESEGEEDDLESEGPISSALDSSVSLVPTESGQGSSLALGLDDSSRTSSSYGNQVHTTLGFSAFHSDEREEYLDSSRRSSSLIPDATSPISPIYPTSSTSEHRTSSQSQFRYPPPSTSSMAIHGHDTMRFSTVSGPLSSFQSSSFEDRPPSSSFSPPPTQPQDLHPLHQSIYLSNPETGINASRDSLESISSGGSSFHDEMVDSLVGTGEMDRGLSVLVDNGRRVDWDQLESSSKDKRDGGEDLRILGGLTMEDVVAIQERLVKDRVGGVKGEWVGGVGLGGAGLLLGAEPVEVKVEREEGQEVWSRPPSDLGLLRSHSSNLAISEASSLPRSAPSSTAGSEYSETFPQTNGHPAPSLATSHRSYASTSAQGVGYHRPRPAPSPSPASSSSSPQPTENLLVPTTPQQLNRPVTPTTPKDNQLTPSTPTNAKFSSSTPSTPLGRGELMDPDFISDYRAKIEAADKTIRELKKSPSMPKMGIRSRTKSIKRMPKNQISSPQLISTTARLNTTDLPLDLQTQSLGNSTGSSVSQRLRNMGGGGKSSRERPESPPPLPTSSRSAPRSPAQQQPAFFSRPSLDQVVHQASQDRPAFVFPNRAASPSPSPAPPVPHKIGKAKRSFLGLLRSRKSSDVVTHPPTSSNNTKTRPSPPFSPQQSQPPVVDISHSSMDRQDRTPTFPPSPFDNSDRSVRDPTLSHTPGSREEGSIHAFYDAAEKLGIDPAEVNQLLQRSTSTTARKYSSIRSNSISNSIDLTSPSLTRAPSKRSVVGGIPEAVAEEDHQRPLRVVSVVDSEGGGGGGERAMNLSASVRSALNRAGSTKSRNGNPKGSGSVLRRTIIFASESRMSSYRPAAVPEDGTAAANEFEVLTDGVVNGMPSPLGSRFNLARHSTSSSRGPPRSPSDGSFFRGAGDRRGGDRGDGLPPPSPSETSFIRAGHSSTHASLYDLYYDENDPERSDTTQTSILPPSQSTNSIAPQPGQAVEILELANGDVVYSVLQGLRDMEDYDDERWDEHSDAASTMDRPPSSLIDEPVQLTFRGQQSLVEPHRSVFKPSRPARPETKVFYSSSKQVADLIAEISRSHDTGSLQFQASTPSPTSSSFPTSPPPAPLNLPKRSISVRRRSQHSTAALAPHHQHHGSGGGSGGRGVSDAPSLSPSQLSVETNLDRLMGSLMLQGESEGGKRESLV